MGLRKRRIFTSRRESTIFFAPMRGILGFGKWSAQSWWFYQCLDSGLNQYREDLHERFLEENGNNEELVGVIEKNLFGIYLKTFDLSDDALTNISFRINTEHKDDFVQIHDEILRKVDMSFSAYLVSLLNEYAGKPFFLREKENKVYRWKSEESADEKKQSKKRFYQKRKRTKTGR
jgi:hypothetical protein